MNTETNLSKACKTYREKLPELLLEDNYAAQHPELLAHSAECAPCLEELVSLQQTMALLDEYKAPEPSLYFDTRLHARLREAQAAPPEGFWERMRSYLQFSTGRSFRPAVAGALAAVLVLGGGGTLLQVHHDSFKATATETSSAVNDLKVMDNNEQAEQQMGQLLDLSGSEDGDTQPTS